MAGRIRTIKPEILIDEDSAALSDGAWRLFVSLFAMVDDEGLTAATPAMLHGQVFWARPRPGGAAEVASMLEELRGAELVRLYSVRGSRYLQIVNWKKHQKIDKPSKPKFPTPNEADQAVAPNPREDSRALAEPSNKVAEASENLPEPSPSPPRGKGREGKGSGSVKDQAGELPLAGGDKPSEVTQVRQRLQELHTKAAGAEHTWSAREAGMVGTLLRYAGKLGVGEVLRRMELLYSPQCPAWIANGGRDLGSLVSQWNKLGQAPEARGPPRNLRVGRTEAGDFEHATNQELPEWVREHQRQTEAANSRKPEKS